MIRLFITGISIIILCCNCAYGQKHPAPNGKDIILRFDIVLKTGTYAFFEGEHFPSPKNADSKPETFIPDDFFSKNARLIQVKNTTTKYGAYILTAKSEYVYLKINGKNGWLRASIPIEPSKIVFLRNEL